MAAGGVGIVIRALRVAIYRSADDDGRYDTTNGGVTSRRWGATSAYLITHEGNTHRVMPGDVVLGLVHSHAGLIAAPDEQVYETSGARMFGGNFVWSSDSRFPGRAPIPVHDRFEAYNASYGY